MDNDVLDIGKLEPQLLQDLIIDKLKMQNKEVKVGSAIGADCAIIDFADYDCVVSSDPVTASVNDIGRLAIHVSCNDIAASGGLPIAITLTVLLPAGTTKNELIKMIDQALTVSEELGVEIIGGHTEVTKAVNQPVIVATALGKKKPNENASLKVSPGNVIFMTKKAGIEGTAIIASDFEEELIDILSKEETQTAVSLFDQISVVKEGLIAEKYGVSLMHDVTEGGILGAVWEMCKLSDVGCVIHSNNIPVHDVTKKICNHYKIDYLGLISSGTMLMIAAKVQAEQIIEQLKKNNVDVSVIGEIKQKEFGIMQNIGIDDKNIQIENLKEIIPPGADELYKIGVKK